MSFDQVYLCCCSDCDLPTKFSRSDFLSHTHLHWVCAFRDQNFFKKTYFNPKFLFPMNFEEFPEAMKQLVIHYNENIKVVRPKPHFHGGNLSLTILWVKLIHNKFISMRRMILINNRLFVTLKPNHPLFWIHLILNPSQFTLQEYGIHLMTLLKMWINLISVNPPAPLPI